MDRVETPSRHLCETAVGAPCAQARFPFYIFPDAADDLSGRVALSPRPKAGPDDQECLAAF